MRQYNRNSCEGQRDQRKASTEELFRHDFARLCEADMGEFTGALDAVTHRVALSALSNSSFGDDLLNALLPPCFKVRADGELYFEGDYHLARYAKCLAALLNHLGWDRLSLEAQIWAIQLKSCNVPATLNGTGPMDIEKGRALMQHLVRHDFATQMHPNGGRKTQPVIDPFIGT